MFKTLAITTTAIMISFTALAPSSATAGQNVQVAALQQAEHEAINIIKHLQNIKNGIHHREMNLQEAKKKLEEIERAKPKNEAEKKKLFAMLEGIKHEIQVIEHSIERGKDQLHHGRQVAVNLGRHLENRTRYLEQEMKKTIREIEMMEKAKKPAREIDDAKQHYEKMKSELNQINSFLHNLKRELAQVGSA